jgi:hypothetical protein
VDELSIEPSGSHMLEDKFSRRRVDILVESPVIVSLYFVTFDPLLLSILIEESGECNPFATNEDAFII